MRQQIKNQMERIIVVHDINTRLDNYLSTYLQVIVPEEEYNGIVTNVAIKYYLSASGRRPDRVRVIVYNDWLAINEGNSYAKYEYTK